jgi:ATP-dependent helicase/nuclease subunit B
LNKSPACGKYSFRDRSVFGGAFLMAVQFILGRSGTGKTSRCINSIIRALAKGEKGPPLVLLVPDQATYQAQRAILAGRQITGYSRLRVLSFERLSFLLIGKHTAKQDISKIGREMIIHKILRTERDKLGLLGQTAQTPGLAAKLAEIIKEMHECACSGSDVRQLALDLAKAEPHNMTAMKFADIALIFDHYEKFIAPTFADPDMQLQETLKKIPQADFLKNAKLWVDGFADFTVAQRILLVEMLKVASESHIALCLDPHTFDPQYPDRAELDDTSLFGPTERTFADLVEKIRQAHLPLAQPILLDRPMRFSSSPPLAHIEKNIFSSDPPPLTTNNDIHIVSTANRRAEINYIAGQIVKLVRERDYRFGDIAVIASDISAYQHYIEALFTDYNIPFFIDKPKSLLTHPAIELITSALKALINNFSSSDIFACLKTGLTNVEQSDIDILENYCLAFGIDGNDWTASSDWTFAPKDDAQFNEKTINKIRRQAIAPLSRLRADLALDKDVRPITAGRFTKAVWLFLENLDIRSKLSHRIQHDPEDRQLGHRQFYDKLVNLFDELDEIFADELMSVPDWTAILSNAFSKLALKLIPPTLDQVLVGSIERSRHPDLKAVFCAGATQKQFPQPVSFDSLLTDDDRIVAAGHDFHLAEMALQQLTNRQYLAYIAFTRPSQYLCITYPLSTDSGAPAFPSPFLDNLKILFVDLTDQPASDTTDVEDALSEAQLADLLCAKLGKDSTLSHDSAAALYALVEGLNEDEKLSPLSRRVKYALSYENKATLDKDFAKKLYGASLQSSATRLGSFAACPFQYFARYVLDLQPRTQFTLQPLDLGRFYHRVLDSLFKKLKRQNADFATASDRRLQQACAEAISAVIAGDTFLSNFKNRSRHNAYILDSAADILNESVRDYATMAKSGSFRQVASELAFGMNAQDPIQCRLRASDGVTVALKGIIDRIDCADINGRQVALIFDYKRKSRSVSWSRFYHALDMQLAIYMLAVSGAKLASGKIEAVAGAFYIPIETAPSKGSIADLKHHADKFTHKAKGIFDGQFANALDTETKTGQSAYYNFRILQKDRSPYGDYGRSGALKPDQFARLLDFTRTKIIQLAAQITSGCITITPYRLGLASPCSYCHYRPVCKFDWQINDYNPLAPAGKEELLPRISQMNFKRVNS